MAKTIKYRKVNKLTNEDFRRVGGYRGWCNRITMRKTKKKQKYYYSGKKKKHTLKTQVIATSEGKILAVCIEINILPQIIKTTF